MTFKNVLIGIVVLVIFLSVGWVVLGTRQDVQDSDVSDNDKALLLRAVEDPFMVHIRTAIDNFNEAKTDGISSEVDLSRYKEYLASKFVLMEVDNNAVMGGKTALIVFVEKPDKFFYLWVYEKSDGSYDLRAFQPYEEISDEQARAIYESSKSMIEELGLAM